MGQCFLVVAISQWDQEMTPSPSLRRFLSSMKIPASLTEAPVRFVINLTSRGRCAEFSSLDDTVMLHLVRSGDHFGLLGRSDLAPMCFSCSFLETARDRGSACQKNSCHASGNSPHETERARLCDGPGFTKPALQRCLYVGTRA